jgi:hypothetical protein
MTVALLQTKYYTSQACSTAEHLASNALSSVGLEAYLHVPIHYYRDSKAG